MSIEATPVTLSLPLAMLALATFGYLMRSPRSPKFDKFTLVTARMFSWIGLITGLIFWQSTKGLDGLAFSYLFSSQVLSYVSNHRLLEILSSPLTLGLLVLQLTTHATMFSGPVAVSLGFACTISLLGAQYFTAYSKSDTWHRVDTVARFANSRRGEAASTRQSRYQLKV